MRFPNHTIQPVPPPWFPHLRSSIHSSHSPSTLTGSKLSHSTPQDVAHKLLPTSPPSCHPVQQPPAVAGRLFLKVLYTLYETESSSLFRVPCDLKGQPGKDTISNRSSNRKVYADTTPGLVPAQTVSRRGYKRHWQQSLSMGRKSRGRQFRMGQRSTLCTFDLINFYNRDTLLLSIKINTRPTNCTKDHSSTSRM